MRRNGGGLGHWDLVGAFTENGFRRVLLGISLEENAKDKTVVKQFPMERNS